MIAQSSTKGIAQAQCFTASFNLVSANGFATAGDSGHGLYRRVTVQPAHPACFCSAARIVPDGSTNAISGGWWELVPSNSEINVLQLGADPTGATTSDAAFQAAFQIFCAYRNNGPRAMRFTPSSIGACGQISHHPAQKPDALLLGQGGSLKGADLDQTNIIFAPTARPNVLMYNQALFYCFIEGITFMSTGLAQTFYRADTTVNNQQAWTSRRCGWQGVWGFI